MTDEQGRTLLRIAREALRATLGDRAEPRAIPTAGEFDDQPRGVFVTLRNGRRLRGCIGTFHPRRPLPETVWDMAVSAASDPRFVDNPVTWEELPDLRIEVSVLSPLRRASDPLALRIGVDGIYISAPTGSGCFLPEVAVECGWTPEQFLSACCEEKAGLPADAWRDPATEVFVFTVEHFAEPTP